MCEECVAAGRMTQEELDTQMKDGENLVARILNSLVGQHESVGMNILLSALIHMTIDIGAAPADVMEALSTGFQISMSERVNTRTISNVKIAEHNRRKFDS